MKKLVVILATCGLFACASLPNDVKDFINEPGHQEIASKCITCHLNLTDSVD